MHRCRSKSRQRWASRVSGSNTNAHSEGGGITSRQILRGPDEDFRVSPAERHPPGRPGFRGTEGRARELPLAGWLAVEPELLAHILLTGEYRWPKRR